MKISLNCLCVDKNGVWGAMCVDKRDDLGLFDHGLGWSLQFCLW
jgi:hypothetical protein